MADDDDFPEGAVWLVGAGPGDPELLTRKAERLIGTADTVLYDALIGTGILDLASRRADLIYVGKRSGRHSRDQASIDRLIVEAALAGNRVVRLKGGDPAIFGRASEELAACRAAGVAVRICPGVTAASAAAADLGLSLTVRGVARRLSLVTGHIRAGEALDLDWDRLADPQATLAIYMGRAAAAQAAARLMAAGLRGGTPVALIENVSLPRMRPFFTRLNLLPLAARTAPGDGPVLILVGEAIRSAALSAPPRARPGCRPPAGSWRTAG